VADKDEEETGVVVAARGPSTVTGDDEEETGVVVVARGQDIATSSSCVQS